MTATSAPRLSVLDLVPVTSGSTASAALAASTQLARRADELGFTRYWVAEHHGMPGVASSSPPVLLAHLAAATRRIRMGSGGVMLPNHAPLVVAEQFGLLEALHPGRVDLGIGRAPGTDQRTAAALRRTVEGLDAEDFPQQLVDLLAYFHGPVDGVHAIPAEGNAPDVWLLGSSGYSAQVAGMLGLPFAFAHHFMPQNTLPALALYRSTFRPSDLLAEPYAAVCVGVTCAPTTERAQALAEPGALSFLRLRSGQPGPLPTEAETAAHRWTPAERAFADERLASQVIGDPATVREGLLALAAETMADELIVTTMVPDPADRVTSYDLVAGLASTDAEGSLRLPVPVPA